MKDLLTILTILGLIKNFINIFQGYQFWVKTNEKGNFSIENVRPGTYNLYAFVPGIIGDYVYEERITIEPGNYINMAIKLEPFLNDITIL